MLLSKVGGVEVRIGIPLRRSRRLRSGKRHDYPGYCSRKAVTMFIRAALRAGKNPPIKPITTATGRNIVTQRVIEALGPQAAGSITPHSFRHYFVSTILRASSNLKLAQKLARHENIQITQRYAHIDDEELDKGYYEVFEKRTNPSET